MIHRDELIQIGQFKKPHGIKGEIAFSFTDVMAGLTRHPLNDDFFLPTQCPFLICEINGILVPFRVDNYRLISDSTAYIQLKNIDSDQKACILTHKKVFFPKKYVEENIENDSFTWDYFIGFTLTDERLGKIGRIVEVNKATINTLFIVERENEEILIPAVEEFIIRIDENQKEWIVALPEGLVE
jgi:16S rRNA processing protein RimM